MRWSSMRDSEETPGKSPGSLVLRGFSDRLTLPHSGASLAVKEGTWGRWTSLMAAAAGPATPTSPRTATSIPPQEPLTLLGHLEPPTLFHSRKTTSLSFALSHHTTYWAVFSLCTCYFTSMTMDHEGIVLAAIVLYPEPPEHSMF